jgi:murein L,D-transpeptidase YafK
MKYLLHILTLISFSLLFVACVEEPEVSTKEHYNLKECKEELLDATDYAQDAGIDKIVVVKKDRKMYLYKEGKIEDEIPVSLGKNPVGHKQKQGDNRTPEGEFFIHRKLCSPK